LVLVTIVNKMKEKLERETIMDSIKYAAIVEIAKLLRSTGSAKLNDDYSIQVHKIYSNEYYLVDSTGEKYNIKNGLDDIQAVIAAFELIN